MKQHLHILFRGMYILPLHSESGENIYDDENKYHRWKMVILLITNHFPLFLGSVHIFLINWF